MLNLDLNSAAMQYGLMGNGCAQSRVDAGRDHRLSLRVHSGKRLLGAFPTPVATTRTTGGVVPVTVEPSMRWRPEPVMSRCTSPCTDTPAAIWASLIINRAQSL